MSEHSTENDQWGESPEDVLLCLYQDETGHCSKPYGHDGPHDVRAAFCCAQRQACVSDHDGDYGSPGHSGPCCDCEPRKVPGWWETGGPECDHDFLMGMCTACGAGDGSWE